MLNKHASMWKGELGKLSATSHYIKLKKVTVPNHHIPYIRGPEIRYVTQTHIYEEFKTGVIEAATSEWVSPVVLVPNKYGTIRFCIYYRILKQATIPDTYPLPRLE